MFHPCSSSALALSITCASRAFLTEYRFIVCISSKGMRRMSLTECPAKLKCSEIGVGFAYLVKRGYNISFLTKEINASAASHVTKLWNHDSKITTQTEYHSLLPSIPGNIWAFFSPLITANRHSPLHQSSLTKEVLVCVICWFAPDCVTPKIKIKINRWHLQMLASTFSHVSFLTRRARQIYVFSLRKKNDVSKTL